MGVRARSRDRRRVLLGRQRLVTYHGQSPFPVCEPARLHFHAVLSCSGAFSLDSIADAALSLSLPSLFHHCVRKTQGPPPALHDTRQPAKRAWEPWECRYEVLEEPVTLPTATTSEAEQHAHFVSIAEEFQCPVCAYTAVDAVSIMTCGHVLCERCADDCTANKYTKCPHAGCGLPFRRREIQPAYRIRNVLAVLPASAKQVHN